LWRPGRRGRVGFEVNKACVDFGRARGLDLRAELWTAETPVPAPNLIVCIMVLERIHWPRRLLQHLIRASRRYEAPLFVSVPWFGRSWWHYVDAPVEAGVFHPLEKPDVHVTHFSRAGFEKVVSAMGVSSLRFVQAGWSGYLMR
jgi:hypothetical protein